MSAAEREALRAGLPADMEAERAVLSEILRAQAVPEAARALTGDHFTVGRYRSLWEALGALRGSIDPMALTDILGPQKLAGIGGPAFLSGLLDPAEYCGDVQRLVERLDKRLRQRRHMALSDKMTSQAARGELEPELLEELGRLASGRPRAAMRVEDIPSVWNFEASAEYVVEDLILSGAITLLTGDSGVGKSTLALALAGAVAHGQAWAGRAVRQRRVLYLDRENPLYVVKDRLHRMGIAPTAALTVWGGWNDPGPPAPAAPAIMEYAVGQKPLIVVDSLVAFHDGSEQDATETRRFLDQLRRLANLGATVLLIHHTGKAETAKEYRGSSDIKASMDAAFLMQPLGGDGSQLDRLSLRPFKARSAPLRPILLEYRAGAGFQAIHDTAAAQRDAARNVVEAIVRDTSGCSREHVLAEARRQGVSRDDARDALAGAERDGRLAVQTADRGRKIYTLAGGGWDEI